MTPNSNKSFDAFDKESGVRYQIKSRRRTNNRKLQLGIIRNFNFDLLVVVIFDKYFNILKAIKIDSKSAKKCSKFSDYQNGYILHFENLIDDPNTKIVQL